jgi:uncharacterized YccA/Bax inhibitor family protein
MPSNTSPFLKEENYRNAHSADQFDKMTVQGAVNKSFILLGILLFSASYSFASNNSLWIMVGGIAGFITVIIARFRPQNSNILAPTYAAFEGLFVGGITALYSNAFHGIVFQAITLTIGVLFSMLFLYKAQIIKVTANLRTGIMMATASIAIFYLLTWVLSFFGINMPFIHEGGVMGIGLSVVIVGVAAMNLLLDFDRFDKGEQCGAPQYMEWYSAMSLLVTLIWLYLEILRLLSKLSRD